MGDGALRLAARLDELVAGLPQPSAVDGVRGAILRVEVPGAGFAWSGAAGMARADTGEPVSTAHRFHVASVGKLVTGTLVVRAATEGLLGPAGIDATLGDLAAAGVLAGELARGVHPLGPTITVRQLLTHTSGMKDVQGDDASGTARELGGPAPDSVQASFVASASALAAGMPDPTGGFARHRWVPWDPDRPGDPMAGMLNRFLATGTAAQPVGAPGERFHYSDTAYVLLGVLVEAASGRRYHELQRSWVLEPLGLVDTYLAYGDDPSPDARRTEMDVWMGPVPLLSTGCDLSLDWAGGGQVSTVGDLCRLLRGLLGGELHDGPTTAARRAWVEPAGLAPPFAGVGLGLLRWWAGERAVVGHAGAWGVRAFHDPATGAFVAGTVSRPDPCPWLAEAFDLVAAEFGAEFGAAGA